MISRILQLWNISHSGFSISLQLTTPFKYFFCFWRRAFFSILIKLMRILLLYRCIVDIIIDSSRWLSIHTSQDQFHCWCAFVSSFNETSCCIHGESSFQYILLWKLYSQECKEMGFSCESSSWNLKWTVFCACSWWYSKGNAWILIVPSVMSSIYSSFYRSWICEYMSTKSQTWVL